MTKKNFYKPLYKNFIKLRKNIQNRPKFIFFKKQKWKKLIQYELNLKKKIRVYDHIIYFKPKFGFNFKNKFRFYLYSKQKLKLFYGKLSEKNLNQIYRNAYRKFKNQKSDYLKNKNFYLIDLLEKRLDVILYRTTFVNSIRTAQQLISHGKVFVNSKKITISSYCIQKGDLLEIDFISHKYLIKNMSFSENLSIIPKYLEINFKTFQCLIVSDINLNKIVYNFPFWLNLNKLFKLY